MLLSELLGTQVVTIDGDELGHVHDVVLVQDGPMGSNGRAGLRLHALAIGSRRLLQRSPRLVSWSAIVQCDEHRIVVDPSLDAPDQD